MLRLSFLLVAVLFSLTPLAQAQREKLDPEDLDYVEKNYPKAVRTYTGLRTQVLKEGAGELVQPGDLVEVLYVGSLIDGTVFDKAQNPEKPFSFRVARGMVIDGWEEGLQLMRPGEKRLLIVPFELGYGSKGNPPKIPRRATLIFEVELLKVTRGS